MTTLPATVCSGPNWLIRQFPSSAHRELMISEAWSDDILQAAAHENVRAVYVRDWETPDVSFLCHLPQTLELNLALDHPCDLSAVHGLAELRSLKIFGAYVDQLDFTRLPALRSLWVTSERIHPNYLACEQLEELRIPSSKITDLCPLQPLRNLKTLQPAHRTLKSLDGLDAFPSLENLSLGELKWSSLDGLQAAPRLRSFSAHVFPQLSDIRARLLIRILKPSPRDRRRPAGI